MLTKLNTLALSVYVKTPWLRWRRAEAESGNINRLAWAIFALAVAILLIAVIGGFIVFGGHTVQQNGYNALNSVSGTSGSTSVGGFTSSYSGSNGVTLPAPGSVGSGN
jgi:hypothetical protein